MITRLNKNYHKFIIDKYDNSHKLYKLYNRGERIGRIGNEGNETSSGMITLLPNG